MTNTTPDIMADLIDELEREYEEYQVTCGANLMWPLDWDAWVILVKLPQLYSSLAKVTQELEHYSNKLQNEQSVV